MRFTVKEKAPWQCLKTTSTIDKEYKDLWRHSSVRSGIGKSVLTGMEGKEFVSLKKAQLRIS